ncbi:TniQ family protein [Kitasatospora sp. MBT63]|uniref:TniQ family protein n=1 Tax=Kitasatospora sp. MBT63 TaxID=1444768 RepID=UPI000539972D|nr:TniQ family protein [Kitasatospora sp. MBT63]
MTTAPAPLARSLAPLSQESLAGYVLRLAHRLRRPPGRIGVLTGLAPYRLGRMARLPAHLLVDLGPERAAAFAAATRLSPPEVAALGLRQYAATYPPMAQAGTRTDGRVGFNVWAFTTASRFCPDCLAGDGSPIEHEHGGAWSHRWHLPVVFACTRHRRLLEHLCPNCRRPANLSYDGRASAILHLQGASLHPAQCRNLALDAPSRKPRPLCGADLITSDPVMRSLTPAQLTTVLRLQERLDQHLCAGAGTGSLFFPDLVAVSQLIKITWPIAADHAPLPTALADTLDTHIQDVRRRTADLPRGHNGREVIGPPAPAAATAALLAMSEHLLAEPDAATLREAMQALARTAFDTDRLRYAGIIRRQLSTPLALALSRQQFGFHATAGAGTSGVLRVASRPCLFAPRHVPQLLPTDWYERHLADFTAHLTVTSRSNTRLVRRAAALKLAEMTLGGTRDDGARLLAIPPGHAVSGFKQLRARTPDAHWGQFLAAVEAIAAELDGQDQRIDYARRRAALSAWAIPEEHWAALAAGLPTARAMRLPASVLLWARVTEGEYLFSPLVRADGTGPQLEGGGDLVREAAGLLGVRRGDKARLLERLAPYAEELAARCDARPAAEPAPRQER